MLFRKLRHIRLVQVLGILIAVAGLLGYWVNSSPEQIVLDSDTHALLNPQDEVLQATFVVAGRDYFYPEEAPYVMRDGKKVRLRPAKRTAYGTNTDTVLFVSIVGNQITLISIPRDTYVPAYDHRINTVYGKNKGDGAAALRGAVGTLMGVPVQYHIIVNIDVFKRVVDAVGGVTLNVPYPMFHQDDAAGLLIDLKSGMQHLDGEQASNFVRYRGALGDDYRRIDNVKTLLAAFIDRVQQLNLRALGAVPRLIDTYNDEVETNVPPQLVVQFAQHLNTASLRALTLPTHEREGTTALHYDPVEVERFLASVFGGKVRKVVKTPDIKLLITNRSGSSGLALKVQRYLIALGIPKQNVVTRNATFDPVPTRLLVTAPSVADAPFYADLFSVGWQQVYRLEPVAGANVGMELVLGKDAAKWADKL